LRPSKRATNLGRLRQALKDVFDDPGIDEITDADLLGDYPSIRYVRHNDGLIVAVTYKYRTCRIRFIGTHKAYDRSDVAPV
jgi:mRNA-degrading endonuclease HigB of HigAB toxin-antitoxin module